MHDSPCKKSFFLKPERFASLVLGLDDHPVWSGDLFVETRGAQTALFEKTVALVMDNPGLTRTFFFPANRSRRP